MNRKGLESQVETESNLEANSQDSTALPTVAVESPARPTSTRQRWYELDLRIHSPASLGYLAVGGIESALALVRLAKAKGLHSIGITDFYSGQFVDRVCEAAKESEIKVLPGFVARAALRSCDDVPLLCLFPAETTGEKIESILKKLQVPSEQFGKRAYLLQLPFGDVIDIVEQADGIIIPSRIDKTPHRQTIIADLVEVYGFRTFDLAYHDSLKLFKQQWPRIKFNLWSFSSAYALAQIGSRSARVKLPDLTFDALKCVARRADKSALDSVAVEARNQRVGTGIRR